MGYTGCSVVQSRETCDRQAVSHAQCRSALVVLPWLTQLAVCLAHFRPWTLPCSRVCCHIGSTLVQAHNEITEGLQTQLVNLRREKDASDRALQSKHADLQSAQDGAAAAQASLLETRTRCIELYQELSSLKDSLAEANTTKVCAIQVGTAAWYACCHSRMMFISKS